MSITKVKISLRYRLPSIEEAIRPYSDRISGVHPFWHHLKRLPPCDFDTLAREVFKDGITGPIITNEDDLLLMGLDELMACHAVGLTVASRQFIRDSSSHGIEFGSIRQFRADLKERAKARRHEAAISARAADWPQEDADNPLEPIVSFFESEEGMEITRRLDEKLRQREATLPTSERLQEFLGYCGSRGHKYRPGVDPYPTLKQLAKYCGCDVATISRIRTGDQQSIRQYMMDILLALAGIVPVLPPTDRVAERIARMNDADQCVSLGMHGKEVRLAIFDGIERRH